MRLETRIRKGLGLKARRVREVREEAGKLVAEIEWIEGRALTCSGCSRKVRRLHARPRATDWLDLPVRHRPSVLRNAARGLRERRWEPRRVIGIDEVSRSKGRRCLTLVYDLVRRRLEPFACFARRVRQHLPGILAWTRIQVSSAALEGMNDKVKVVGHRAYGFRKPDTYITAIWHACGDLPLT